MQVKSILKFVYKSNLYLVGLITNVKKKNSKVAQMLELCLVIHQSKFTDLRGKIHDSTTINFL